MLASWEPTIYNLQQSFQVLVVKSSLEVPLLQMDTTIYRKWQLLVFTKKMEQIGLKQV